MKYDQDESPREERQGEHREQRGREVEGGDGRREERHGVEEETRKKSESGNR